MRLDRLSVVAVETRLRQCPGQHMFLNIGKLEIHAGGALAVLR